ncbi:hypothetical protein SteCoe_15171 [Stentor coeruleus]|uniref:Histidine kinase n=1 Tax=Stentor coeruleus TaxID=5963 RepID=A0A1R2C4B9_9CILI|nr:hypothetical protein SteCoe_15171 [Stentor coeruleus]
MKSEWWDQYFCEFYLKFTKIVHTVCLFSLVIRLLESYAISYEVAFGKGQLQFLMIVLMLSIGLWALSTCNSPIKKLMISIVTEAMNIFLRYTSIYIIPSASNLFCLESTILTIFFQANIFEGFYPNLIIVIKHILTWGFFNNQISYEYLPTATIIVGTFATYLWVSFEHDKRLKLRERFLSKKAMIYANKQLTELLKALPDGFFIFNNNKEIKYSNDMMNKIFKTDRNFELELIKNVKIVNCQETISEKLQDLDFDKILSHTSLGFTDIESSRYEWLAKRIEWGNEKSCIVIVKDVTLVLSLERMAGENKAKSSLIKSVSHELRTPVNGINLIIDEIFPLVQKELAEKLRHIKICTSLLNFQIADILDFSELATDNFQLNFTLCDLKDALNECAKFISVQVNHKGLEFFSKIDSLIPESYFCDRYRIQKVIMNLLNNAIKFTSKGDIELCAINTGRSIEISVADSGIGIPKERLKQIFEMFSGDSNSLCGLGLHISQNILKLLGSNLTVSSIVGQGSIFSFSLKLPTDFPEINFSCESEIPCECIHNETIRCIPLRSLCTEIITVLIADDNDFNRICLGNILRSRGIKFIEVINGSEAVKRIIEFDRSRKPIKCVIMDCEMPVMDGWQAAKVITTKYTQGIIKFLPSIIAHTAYSSKEDIQKCYDSGMISYMLKPTPQEEILSIISKYV